MGERPGRGHPARRGLMVTGLVASVLPDLDLIWFYLVNGRQNPHHEFVFHWPLFWVAVALILWIASMGLGLRGAMPFLGIALVSLLLHMVPDSVAAEIAWLMPFSDAEVNLVVVPARHDWWVHSFVLHWTFLLELTICGWAALVLAGNRRNAAQA
ncbi:metal-dependent hydrolase [Paracoccus angustae]|uniref:Metal-dependent hydrolase n=1 Tax=Paracoccus angustae TaxID=1671480 RepID=A0ABV7U6S3_9RHOB